LSLSVFFAGCGSFYVSFPHSKAMDRYKIAKMPQLISAVLDEFISFLRIQSAQSWGKIGVLD
jgi:hypothetical protein